MSNIIEAIYESGLLRPLQPLLLTDNQMVKLQIIEETDQDIIERVLQNMAKDGLLSLPKKTDLPNPVSDEELERIADIFGKAAKVPLSQMIIEDRGDY